MATNDVPLPPLGMIKIRVDRVYGKLTIYPACPRSELIAQIAGTKTLTHSALALAERLGFEITEDNCMSQVLGEVLAQVSKVKAGMGVKS